MGDVGSYEAKTHLPALLKRVSQGEKFTISRHGIPVAFLVPVQGSQSIPPLKAIDAIRHFRRGRRLGTLSLQKMKEAGRR